MFSSILMAPSGAVAPIALAAVFILAGVAKLLHGSGGELARKFGLPQVVTRLRLERLLPWLELATGVALLLAPGAAYAVAAALAFGLTGVFLILVTRSYLRHEDFECGCFGAWDSARISRALIARNGLLVLIALFVCAQAASPYAGVPTTVTRFSPSDIGWASSVCVLVALIAVSAIAARRSKDQPVMADAASTPTEGRISDVEVVTRDGNVIPVGMLATQRPRLLLFVKAGCGACEALLARFGEISRDLEGKFDVTLSVSTSPRVFETVYAELVADSVFAVSALRERLGVGKNPAAVVLGLNGTITHPPVQGAAAVDTLVQALRHVGDPGGALATDGLDVRAPALPEPSHTGSNGNV